VIEGQIGDAFTAPSSHRRVTGAGAWLPGRAAAGASSAPGLTALRRAAASGRLRRHILGAKHDRRCAGYIFGKPILRTGRGAQSRRSASGALPPPRNRPMRTTGVSRAVIVPPHGRAIATTAAFEAVAAYPGRSPSWAGFRCRIEIGGAAAGLEEAARHGRHKVTFHPHQWSWLSDGRWTGLAGDGEYRFRHVLRCAMSNFARSRSRIRNFP